jgi:2-dehydro-3-deoxygalactonokinase
MRGRTYIAVDWGSSNRRAYLVDADGALLESFADERGVLAVGAGGFGADVEAIRARLGPHPMLLAGMVGSNRGWLEAPYAACPVGLAELAGAIRWVEPGQTGIVPGAALRTGHADVMRGEEVQALGAVAAGLVPPDATICHPGTHAKWIDLRDGLIVGFQTVMTGEIFALLKTHSILADQLQSDAEADADFADGVALALAGTSPIAALFQVRARALLGAPGGGASFASGLLIGSDVHHGLARFQASTALVGEPGLCTLYAAAIAQAGRACSMVDGARAFRAGMHALVEIL